MFQIARPHPKLLISTGNKVRKTRVYLPVINRCLDLNLQLGYFSLFTTTVAKDSYAVRLNISSAAAEPGVGGKHVPGDL